MRGGRKHRMKTWKLGVVAMAVLSASLIPAFGANAEAPKPAEATSDLNQFTNVVGGIIAGFENVMKAADGAPTPEKTNEIAKEEPAGQPIAKSEEKPASTEEPKVQKSRPLKNSAILIAGSAGLGAAIGKASGKKSGPVIGAIAGGVAGLIYDRITYKNPKGI